ncbi:MAG: aldo/keto reductase [Acidimicrobiia bacterium]
MTRLGLGTAPLGNLFSTVTDADADATFDAAWDAGIRFFDTAPLYGHGLAERRLGRALTTRPRDEYVVATKIGRLLRTSSRSRTSTIFVDVPDVEAVFAYSRDDTLRSIEESLERLGLDRVDVVHVHDPDDHEADAMTGAFPALIELRDQGVIGAVGAGMNQWEMLDRFVQRVDLDCVLLAGRYTLLDRSGADVLLPRCAERKVGVVIGGVFNSGLLADPDANPTYDYVPASESLRARAQELWEIARAGGVTLAAAALQFALAHPAVTAVVVGARTAREVRDDVDDAGVVITPSLGAQLGFFPPH